jgi:hypothetical protein
MEWIKSAAMSNSMSGNATDENGLDAQRDSIKLYPANNTHSNS